MKTYYSKTGPLAERVFYTDNDVEEMCTGELAKLGLMPKAPEPINIERFVEKRFGFYDFQNLDDGVLGFTKFSSRGVEEIVISRSLGEENTKISNRRVRTTLAHEAGHALFHGHLFALAGMDHRSLFADPAHDEMPRILCREVKDGEGTHKPQNNWWEIQANMAIGALLLPRRAFEEAVRPFLDQAGSFFGSAHLDETRREEAARALADVFDVNPAVVRIRLAQLFPS